ncbi:hypothetical protein [Salipiger mucosus]|uniref:Uncharacterized protein n=1 Tax=Salipiger mucosus DSM 16094 TaxID=1123237 RepID=S9Q9S0_9RHOB|nr:hypothetical protein [Salipiger mucosus]EPX76747.1 hypothetical protein Salmuc_04632 [Salipiger mucosus DSM 16094]
MIDRPDDAQRFVISMRVCREEIGVSTEAVCIAAPSADELVSAMLDEIDAGIEAREAVKSRSEAMMDTPGKEATEAYLQAVHAPRYRELPGVFVLGHHIPEILDIFEDENCDAMLMTLEDWFDADQSHRMRSKPKNPGTGIDLKAAWLDRMTRPTP